VVVLDGDGSLLMNLGTLVTIAHAAPKNLVHCFCQNGTYETNGAVSIPGGGKVSFTGLARAAGYPKTYAV
jgi:thiamine pyrophosphate-dependent acetolactate synthase large subunit-like protein